ncbi:MAG: urea ABC transporter permease subunit UrtB, partial [Hyphomicrobium sp.]
MTRLLSALVIWTLLLTATATGQAVAADFQTLVQQLGARDFAAKIGAVEELASTGDPGAVPVLEAMLASQLAVRRDDSRVVIMEQRGRALILMDPLTRAELGEADRREIDAVTINNRLRGVLRGALGGLTLLSPDADTRRAAADAVFKSRDAGLQPILEKAYERETDSGAQNRMKRALSAIRAGSAEAAEQRIAAVRELAGFPDPEVRSLLASVAGADRDAGVRDAA